MRRLVVIVALLVIIPIIEIGLLIAIGQVIGLPLTLLLMLGTSALGAWLLRHEGSRAWLTFRSDLEAGRPPGNSATDGLLVLIGAIFMLVPGFFSDLVGLFMIAPPTRRVARGFVLRAFTARLSPATATTLFGPRRVRATAGTPRHGPASQSYRTDPTGPGSASSGSPISGSSSSGSSSSGSATSSSARSGSSAAGYSASGHTAGGRSGDDVPIEGEIIDPDR